MNDTENNFGRLFVVATPIGNLSDISKRALETLGSVDLILCEDTRTTQKLLSHFEIKSKTLSFHKFSDEDRYQKIYSVLKEGKDLALVSDAGTPAISDPGAFLIKGIREQFPEIEIIPIPGASALTAILSVAGLDSDNFIFLGFPPHKKGRQTFFEEILAYKKINNIPVVFYESKHRLIKALESLEKVLPQANIFLGKEITKIHERYFSGTASEVLNLLKDDENLLKGEFVVIVK